MSRIQPLTYEELTPEQRQVWDAIASGPRGQVEITHNTWLRNPTLSKHVEQIGAFMRYEILEPKQRELTIMLTGRAWKAELEWYLHKTPALEAGLKEEHLQTILRGQRPDFGEPDLTAIYDFCTELHTNQKVSDATYRKAVDALSEKGVVEVVALSGFYVMVAMLLKTFEFPLPDGATPVFEGGGDGR